MCLWQNNFSINFDISFKKEKKVSWRNMETISQKLNYFPSMKETFKKKDDVPTATGVTLYNTMDQNMLLTHPLTVNP